MLEDCIFCKIAEGTIPASIVCEDDQVIAFNDINPQAPIHIVIIPKEHYDSVLSVPAGSEIINHIHTVANRIAVKLGLVDKGFRLVNNCGKDGGQTVQHLHYHLLAGRQLEWPPG